MSYVLVSNVGKIIANTKTSIPLAIRFALEDFKVRSTPRTPKRWGDLRGNTRIQVLGEKGLITWGMNYAFYQENYQYVNYTTAGTGPHFASNSAREVAENSIDYLRKARVIA